MPEGTYAERIREARPRLSKSFKRLADYILDSYIQAALMTASELAHEVDVDAATVVRFAQALDYSGFPELQDEIKARVLDDLHLRPQDLPEPDSLAAKADRTLGELAQAIERTRRLLDRAAFEALVSALGAARRVLILADPGVKSLAHKFAYELETVIPLASVASLEENSLAQALAAASERDLVLALDMSNESALIPAGLAQAGSFGLPTAAIVGGASFEVARRAEMVLEVQIQEKGAAGDIVVAAVLGALADALRLQNAQRYEAHLARVKKARRRLSGKP